MSDLVGLYTALSGLRAAQAGIDTATHNVANVSTPGYTRQRVDLTSRAPAAGTPGTGVDVAGVTRARNEMLDARVRAGAANLGMAATRAALLEAVEQATGEPGGGLSAALGEVWSSFSEVALDPAATAPRAAVLAALERLASEAGRLAGAWAAAGTAAAADLGARVGEVNRLSAEVAALNGHIVAAGGHAPDLADRRDAALDRLGELAGVTVTPTGEGAVRVSVGGLGLVDGTRAAVLEFDAATFAVEHPSGHPVEASGELSGYQQFLTADLPGMRADLDVFVTELAAALNGAHAAGWSSATTPGGPLLAYDPSAPAATLAAAVTDPADIAAATTAGPPFPVFDGGNADAIAGLRTAAVAAGGTMSLEASWHAVATRLGAAAAAARGAAGAQETLHAAAELARHGAHGVSLDEEMAHLLQFQRAYEAAARVMTAVDEALEVLVRRTGLVGR